MWSPRPSGCAASAVADGADTGLSASLLALAAMVLAMAVLPWLLRRWQQRSQAARGVVGVQGQVLHTLALGPGQRVVTVELERDGAPLCLVLGVSAQHIQCLHVWPQGQATAAVVAPTSADIPAQASFAQVLQAVPLSPSSTGPAPATHTKD